MQTFTVAERPDLVDPAWELTKDTLPEYNNNGDVLNRYWGRLNPERPDFQFHIVDDEGEILARACSIPLRWDGTVDNLPAGIDGAIAGGFDEVGANVLCALVIMIPRGLQGRGLSRAALEAMLEIARRHGLGSLIAPVRPTWLVIASTRVVTRRGANLNASAHRGDRALLPSRRCRSKRSTLATMPSSSYGRSSRSRSSWSW